MRRGVFYGKRPPRVQSEMYYYARCDSEPATGFEGLRGWRVAPQHGPGGLMVEMTLEQACPPEYWRAQCAFKDSMIH